MWYQCVGCEIECVWGCECVCGVCGMYVGGVMSKRVRVWGVRVCDI